MTTFDEAVGEGAWDALTEFVTFPDDPPMLFEGELLEENWKPGTWRAVNVVWETAVQQMLFQDRVLFWGDGLCMYPQVTEHGERLCSPSFLAFLNSYIDEQKVFLGPSIVEQCIPPFLRVGFEITEQTPDGTSLHIVTSPNNRLTEFVAWVQAGSVAADEPEWRTSVPA